MSRPSCCRGINTHVKYDKIGQESTNNRNRTRVVHGVVNTATHGQTGTDIDENGKPKQPVPHEKTKAGAVPA